jgi:hypothetical protein
MRRVMTTSTVEDARYVWTEWQDCARRGDVEGGLALYFKDATIESPLIPRLLDIDRGWLRGHEEIRPFFVMAIDRRPNDRIRGHRETTFLFDGHRLVWEYPRVTPDGEQLDIVEVMEIEGRRIRHHRIYWGWLATEMLIANALEKSGNGEGAAP